MKIFKLTLTTDIKKSNILPLIALCLGIFMVIMDVTIVNVALPRIAKNLHGGISELQWVIAGYTLTFACFLLSAGNLADRFGAKTVFQRGLLLFVLTSFACGAAPTLPFLILFRLFQGIGAALLVPASLALINISYENKQERTKAIGVWSTIGGIAGAIGPILGAILTTWLSWRSVFLVNVPIGILALFLTNKYVCATNPAGVESSFDFPGQILGIFSIGALAFSLIAAGKTSWFATSVIAGFSLFIISLILFLFNENRSKSPMLSLKLFRSPTFSVAIAVALIINIGFYGNLFLLPLYFQQVREYSILMTGISILPQVAVTALASYFSSKMLKTKGPKIPMVVGLSIGVAGFFAMLIAAHNTPSYLMLIIPLAAIGFGTGFTVPAATVAAIHSVPENRAGIASGALNASRQVGSLLGIALFGAIVNSAMNFVVGMHYCLITACAIFLCGCLITLRYVNKEAVEK